MKFDFNKKIISIIFTIPMIFAASCAQDGNTDKRPENESENPELKLADAVAVGDVKTQALVGFLALEGCSGVHQLKDMQSFKGSGTGGIIFTLEAEGNLLGLVNFDPVAMKPVVPTSRHWNANMIVTIPAYLAAKGTFNVEYHMCIDISNNGKCTDEPEKSGEKIVDLKKYYGVTFDGTKLAFDQDPPDAPLEHWIVDDSTCGSSPPGLPPLRPIAPSWFAPCRAPDPWP
ncbi:MAG: hypothetical protein HQK54_16250, partial [Oligoflexales bacterium]|nr:hypothetical protein [Oligoflexales bacterium]